MMNEPRLPPTEPSNTARGIQRLVTWTSAVSMALTGATVASIRQVNPTVQFQFSVVTVLAFIACGVFTVAFCGIVLHRKHSPKRTRRLFYVAGAGAMLGFFTLSIKNVSEEKRMDVTIGTLAAVAVLSLVGWFFSRVVRFLEADAKRDEHPPE